MAAGIESVIAKSIATRQSPAQRLIDAQMGNITPETFGNFTAISNKYPGMSKDLVISMVRQGYNVNTPGLAKITTMDGLAALKTDAFTVDKIKKKVEPKRGVLGAVQNAFDELIYDPFKGTTRLTFAALRSGYDAITTTGRNITALSRGEDISAGKIIDDLIPFGETTYLVKPYVVEYLLLVVLKDKVKVSLSHRKARLVEHKPVQWLSMDLSMESHTH